jgi:hypothetical protein
MTPISLQVTIAATARYGDADAMPGCCTAGFDTALSRSVTNQYAAKYTINNDRKEHSSTAMAIALVACCPKRARPLVERATAT